MQNIRKRHSCQLLFERAGRRATPSPPAQSGVFTKGQQPIVELYKRTHFSMFNKNLRTWIKHENARSINTLRNALYPPEQFRAVKPALWDLPDDFPVV